METKEDWKEIEVDKRYKVSSTGRIYSSVSKRFLNPVTTSRGYKQVTLVSKSIHVHSLVMRAFSPEKRKAGINHINGVKTDNRLVNLEWCTPAENNYHARLHGLNVTHGSLNGNSVLVEAQVACIKKLLNSKRFERKEIAKMFIVSRYTIDDIARGRTWKRVKEQK